MSGGAVADNGSETLDNRLARRRVLADLKGCRVSVQAVGSPPAMQGCRVLEHRDDTLRIERDPDVAPAFDARAPVRIRGTLGDGRYELDGTVTEVLVCSLIVRIDGTIRRLQQRRNFRTPIPPERTLECEVLACGERSHRRLNRARLVDLSAGGTELCWPERLPAPVSGERVALELVLEPGRALALDACVRRVARGPDGTFAGIEFDRLSHADEQLLRAACHQFQRESRR